MNDDETNDIQEKNPDTPEQYSDTKKNIFSPSQTLYDFDVTGKLIECDFSLSLPAICIRNGSQEDLVRVRSILTCQPFLISLFGRLVGGFIGIFIRVFSTIECEVSYCISRKILRRRKICQWSGVAGVPLGILGVVMSFEWMVPNLALFFLGLIAVFCIMIVVIAVKVDLRIAKHKQGTFWIRGCKRAFFKTLDISDTY